MRGTTGVLTMALGIAVVLPAHGQVGSASSLEVVVGKAGIDPDTGFLRIAGEIRNKSKEWVCVPGVDVELLDASGQAISVTSIVTETQKDLHRKPKDGVLAERAFLPPGEVSVFEYYRDGKKIGGKYASHRLTATARTCPASPPTVVLEAFAPKRGDDGWYSVTGRIKNTGSVPCRTPKAVIGLYRADGGLYRAESIQPDETFQKAMGPGQSVPFSIKAIENPGGKTIASVKGWADCSVPD